LFWLCGSVVGSINSLHLPALAALNLSVNLVPDDWLAYGDGFPSNIPKTDFFPFFTSHPNLLRLELNTPGVELKGDPFLR
jgi:hypothetical protein